MTGRATPPPSGLELLAPPVADAVASWDGETRGSFRQHVSARLAEAGVWVVDERVDALWDVVFPPDRAGGPLTP